MLLSSLLGSLPKALRPHVLSGRAEAVRVVRVTDRTQDVLPGDVFVAIAGARFDGHDHLPEGAAAVIVEREVAAPPGVVIVRVASTVQALGPLCAAVEGHPAESMIVVGVTGTNGKTSVTHLVAHLARAAGWSAGVIGTTGHMLDGETLGDSGRTGGAEHGHTTPTAPQLQRLFATFRDRGARLVAMEVSSIGLAAHRVDGTTFSAAAYTNLTRDHLDYHGTMEAYGESKARLFADLLRPGATAVLNADLGACPVPGAVRQSFRVGPDRGSATWNAAILSATARGMSLRIVDPTQAEHLAQTSLVGDHNAENVLCAWALAHAVGIDTLSILAGIASFPGVPGRLERVENARGIAAFVDYAHTDDALKRVLAVLRPLTAGRLLLVFGCGGDRDAGKRVPMGIAARAADLVYLTSDNPRSEDPLAILAAILPGLGDRATVVEPDRAAAIRAAVGACRPGDTLLIAGKGHERTQTIGDSQLPFDDREVCRTALAEAQP